MANKDIPAGSMVFLSEETEWDVGFDNPIGVDGMVCGIRASGFIGVNWSNGAENSYRPDDSDLSVVEDKS